MHSTKAKLTAKTIKIEQRKLPPDILYQWRFPYLVIPLECTLATLRDILTLFERNMEIERLAPCCNREASGAKPTTGQSNGLAMPS